VVQRVKLSQSWFSMGFPYVESNRGGVDKPRGSPAEVAGASTAISASEIA
jgi:hypothetical protein